ncbi:BTB/POZ domain-containing protein [Hibiscus syriacus]|uniref:BTB/POZ domain-containing protein n=1 Tax=Hibiscus syriacus TaxID=106335 RepID=A0A6A3BX86_HIBSY|nr:BTB/POZ domain-containing protein [Hibiscus syriacus]
MLNCSTLVARGQIEQRNNIRNRLSFPHLHGNVTTTSIPTVEAVSVGEQNLPSAQPHLPQPVISLAPSKMTEEDNKKAAAAAVATKLDASTSSAQMLTSVLSSLVAEEAASMNGSLNSGGFASVLSMFPPEKHPKLEKPMPVSDASNSDIPRTTYFNPLQQQAINNMPLAPLSGMQPMSLGNQIPAPFASAPTPSLSPANPSGSQYMQSTGMMIGVMPYGYGANTLPPPPPLPPHTEMNLARPDSQPIQPSQPPQSQPQQQPQSQPQQQPTTRGFYRPPGIGFYGQNPQSTPPVPRQPSTMNFLDKMMKDESGRV